MNMTKVEKENDISAECNSIVSRCNSELMLIWFNWSLSGFGVCGSYMHARGL